MSQTDYRKLYRAKLQEVKALEAKNTELMLELARANSCAEEWQRIANTLLDDVHEALEPLLKRNVWKRLLEWWNA